MLTLPPYIGFCLGDGIPATVDLRPGGRMVFRYDDAFFPARIENVKPRHTLAYRWASGFPGEEPHDGNSTRVEFTLRPEGRDTRLRVVETGFARLVPDEKRLSVFERNSKGWTDKVETIREYTEILSI